MINKLDDSTMECKNTVSNEVLAIGAKSKLGSILEKYVTIFREKIDTNVPIISKDLEELSKEIYIESGMKTTFQITTNNSPAAGVKCSLYTLGHNGTWYLKNKKLVIENKSIDPAKFSVMVDVKEVKVKGALADAITAKIIISNGIISSRLGFSIREVTAILLHEFGHVFDTFMTTGDYVWFNYYLQDGIEILTGKKNNVFKLEMLNEAWLKKNTPEEEWNKFINERTRDNAKRVIVSNLKKMPRHHLMNNPVTAMRREEQMADLFASRLGYGRDFVTANFKYVKYYNDLMTEQFGGIMDVIRICSLVAYVPITLWLIVSSKEVDETNFNARYDDDYERMLKIRRDLIAQLRSPDIYDKELVNNDIAIIDDLLKDFSNNRTMYDSVIEFFRPARRKETQMKKVEEDLEGLLNNDLFLNAYRINN